MRRAKLQELHHNSSTHWLLGFVFMVLIFAAASQPITDPDFWWHLKTGQYIIQTKTIPHVDIFSTTRFGADWIAHEWLSEVLMYSTFRVVSYSGLIALFSILITGSFWIVYRRCRRRGANPYVAGFASLLGAAATVPTWGVRPQMFSLLFASIFICLLEDYVNRSKPHVWWLVPLTLLWANTHAGFALGLALIVLTLVGVALDWLLRHNDLKSNRRLIRPLAMLLLICGVVVCLNPRGPRLYSYPLETLTSHAMMQFIEEWKSPDFHNPLFQPFLLLLFATLSALALSKKRARPGELLMLIVTGWVSLRSARNVAFFALVSTPILAEHSWNWLTTQWPNNRLSVPLKVAPARKSTLPIFNLFLFVIAIAIVSIAVRNAAGKQPETEAEQFPAAAVDFMVSHQPARPIYNEYVWGGYLIWRLYPTYAVYIDGRADVYGDSLVKEFLEIQNGKPDWAQLLESRGIKTVLVKPDVALASLLRRDLGWQNVFEDKQAVIFIRK